MGTSYSKKLLPLYCFLGSPWDRKQRAQAERISSPGRREDEGVSLHRKKQNKTRKPHSGHLLQEGSPSPGPDNLIGYTLCKCRTAECTNPSPNNSPSQSCELPLFWFINPRLRSSSDILPWSSWLTGVCLSLSSLKFAGCSELWSACFILRCLWDTILGRTTSGMLTSKCATQTWNISSTWELARNANFQALFPDWIKNSVGGGWHQ